MQFNKRIFTSEQLVPEIKAIVEEGGVFPLCVTGRSMRPFLTEGIDTVFIEKADIAHLKKGDIVFVYRFITPVLHRISKVTKKGFFMIGDAHVKSDGFFSHAEMIGVVKYIHSEKTNKKRKYIVHSLSCKSEPCKDSHIQFF